MDRDGGIHANEEFIQVLADSLPCAAPDFPAPASVRYEAKSLVRFFLAYNICVKSAYTDYYATTAKAVFHLNIRAGAEAEVILPFNRNKWAFLIEPAFRTFSSSPAPGFEVDYKALQVLACGRYFLFLGPLWDRAAIPVPARDPQQF